MKASFVIGFHTARIDNLLQTLRFLVQQSQVIQESQLVTICQDDIKNLSTKENVELMWLATSFDKFDHRDLNLPCMQLPIVTNTGVDLCESDKVIILESDRILPDGYFASVIDQLKQGIQITCKSTKKLTKPATDKEIITGSFEAVDDHRAENNQIGMRNEWSGNTALWKDDFYTAGKMDENYKGYGWADNDMSNQMRKIGAHTIFRPELELHLWHPQATYGNGDQKAMFINNGLYFCKKWNLPLPDWFRKELAEHKKVLL